MALGSNLDLDKILEALVTPIGMVLVAAWPLTLIRSQPQPRVSVRPLVVIQDFGINTSHGRTLNINTDLNCSRTMDPDTVRNCSSGPEDTMAVGSL